MMLKLNSWFEISEQEYIWYILQGYEITFSDVHVEWRFDGITHRTDGPAVIWASGRRDWWVDGTQMTESEFNETKRNTVD